MKSIKIKPMLNQIKTNRVSTFLGSLSDEIKNDRLLELAGNMAYYVFLALFPFLIFLFGLFSYIPRFIESIEESLALVLPAQIVSLISEIVSEVLNDTSTALFSFAMLATIWSTTQGAKSLITGVNRAYGVIETRPFLAKLGNVLFVIIGIPFFAMMNFFLIVVGELLLGRFTSYFNLPNQVYLGIDILRYVVLIVLLIIYFALFYKLIPNLHRPFRKGLIGALFTTFGWILVSLLFSYYVNNFANYTPIYGSLGSIIVLLLWINLSSIIILIGAEINMLVGRGENGDFNKTSKAPQIKES